MNLIYAIFAFAIFSCKHNSVNTLDAVEISGAKTSSIKKLDEDCPMDSINMQTSEYGGIKFFSENTMRGKGVLDLTINKKINILNMDKSFWGSISVFNNGISDSYDINFPTKVIAREVIPDSEYQVFCFDSEHPKTDNNFLIIYINKEKKLIEIKDIKYNFSLWPDYIKSAYIQLDSTINNVSIDEQKYWYKALKIKNDSMQIKSVSKTDCDYIDSYKNTTIWIKWKINNCKLIKLNFCY